MKIFYMILVSLLFISCEEVIILNLDESEKRLVVDALLTNQDKRHAVRLSYTEAYSFKFKENRKNGVVNATVIIKDNMGNVDTLEQVSPGNYLTDFTTIKGSVGSSYTLHVITANGEEWVSEPEKMLPVPAIESIEYTRDKKDKSEDNPKFYKYMVYCSWHDSLGFDNYYLRNIQYYWAGHWHSNVSWNWVFNDKYFDGQQIKKSLLVEDYGGKDFYLKLNQYSLSSEAYGFWNLVHEQTQITDSDMVNSAVPLYGNVYNKNKPDEYCLGYFQVSAYSEATVYIAE